MVFAVSERMERRTYGQLISNSEDVTDGANM